MMEVSPDLVSKLNFGTSSALEEVAKRVKASKEIGVNIIREHPYYSHLPNCQMEAKIKEVDERISNQKFAALHAAMTNSRECLKECIQQTDANDASLQDANYVYNELLPMLSTVCLVYSNPLQLSDRCLTLIRKFNECWDSRHNYLKNFEMIDAEAMLAEGVKHLECAVKVGAEEASRAASSVIDEETQKCLQNYEQQRDKLKKFVSESKSTFEDKDKKLDADIKTLDSVLVHESDKFDAETSTHKKKGADFMAKMKVNHEKQEELKRQLAALEKEEAALVEENNKENDVYSNTTKSHQSRRESLLVTKANFVKLKNAAAGCNTVMSKIQSASSELAECCVQTKKNTNQLMMETHRTAFERYRDALATLIATYRVQIRDSKRNIDYLQKQLDNLKHDLEHAVQGALNVVVAQKRAEVTRYQRAVVQQSDIIKASQDRVDRLDRDLSLCDKELELRHKVKPEPATEVYNKRLDMIETKWKSDGIGPDHIQKLSLLPDPELRGDTIRGLDPISTS